MPRQLPTEIKFEGHKWNCSSVDFHPAGNLVVSGSWDRTIRIWDVDDGKELSMIDRTEGHTGPVTCTKWHPNGALIASTSADNTTCLWNANTGQRIRTLREHFGWVLSCSFAPDRTKLATASWDKTVRLWDPNTGELLSTLRGHNGGVWACQFYPVGHTSALLATGGEDRTARLWDTRTRKVALTLSGGHVEAVYSVAWSNDGSLIATGSADKTVTLWDPKAGKILRLLKGHEDTVKGCAFAPVNTHNDQNVLATAGGFRALVWNPNSAAGSLVAEAQNHAPGKEVEAVAISHDGRYMATGARDGAVVVTAFPRLPKDGESDVFVDIRERKQTKTTEKWLHRHSRTLQEEVQQQELVSAMRDESSAWLKRRKEPEDMAAASGDRVEQDIESARRNPANLLSARGFGRDGKLIAQEEDEAAEEPSTSQTPVISEPAQAEAEDSEDEQLPRMAPLRKTAVLDDRGKAHPMVENARNQARPQDTPPAADPPKMAAAKPRQRPSSKPVENVDDLMNLLRSSADPKPKKKEEEDDETTRF